MKLRYQLSIAVEEMNAHRFRAFLTCSGVVMGVASVLAMISLGDGAKDTAAKQVEMMGTNQIMVRRQDSQVEDRVKDARSVGISRADANAIRGLPRVEAVSPEEIVWGVLKFENLVFQGNAILVGPDYALVHNRKPSQGRFISAEDMKYGKKVCVLRMEAPRDSWEWFRPLSPVEKVMKRGNPLGKYLFIEGVPFQVVGVIEEEKAPQSPFGNLYQGGWQEVVFIPFTSYWARVARMKWDAVSQGLILRDDGVQTIGVKAESSEAVDAVVKDIANLLLHRHGGVNDFIITTTKASLEGMVKLLEVFNLVFGALAGIGLFVGGIGILNIMLSSLNERIREVGLRKSIGASNNDILRQFLVEAVVLSALGGFLGILLGSGVAYTVSLVSGWKTVLRPEAMFIAFSVSVIVGILFGLYPALKASRLNPIEALRSL